MNDEALTSCQGALLHANEQVALLRSILESSTEHSILTTDLEGVITAWNEGARRLYGYAAHEFTGTVNVAILSPPEVVSSGANRAIFGTARAGGTWSGELSRLRKNGTAFTAHATITLRHDPSGEPTGFLEISKDVTEQKAQESELRSRNSGLELQVREALHRGGRINIRNLEIDSYRRRIERDGKPIDLTPREFEVLWALAQASGHILSYRDLLKRVWGIDFDTTTNVVQVHVSRLRRKLEAGGQRMIETVPRAGYRLRA